MPPEEQPSTGGAIYLARRKSAKWLGPLEAADAEVAIEAATKKFEVKDSRKLLAIRAAVAHRCRLGPNSEDRGAARIAASGERGQVALRAVLLDL